MEELENQDKEKQKELKAKANGNQDILITVDGIDKSLYTTVYPGVAGLESRGTFILKMELHRENVRRIYQGKNLMIWL